MTFLGIIGAPRKGKTVLATIIMVQLYRQNKLNNTPFFGFANYHFLDEMKPIVTYVDNPQYYLGVKTPELGQGLVIWDELWAWLASRGSGSSVVNKFIQQIVFQSGKRGFDTIWTAQLSSSVDKIVRRQTFKFFKTREPTEDFFRYNYVSSTYYDGRKVMPLRIPKSIASQYYKFYDTREIIKTLQPEDLESEPEEIHVLSGVAEIDDNLTEKDKTEIAVVEDKLSLWSSDLKPSGFSNSSSRNSSPQRESSEKLLQQQNTEEYYENKKIIKMELPKQEPRYKKSKYEKELMDSQPINIVEELEELKP